MKIKVKNKIEIENKKVCKHCNGKGYVFDGKGKDVHVCYYCLKAGRLS